MLQQLAEDQVDDFHAIYCQDLFQVVIVVYDRFVDYLDSDV